MNINSKIYIAGHNGMVGSAILRNLELEGYSNFVFTPYPDYDLTNQKTVQAFFEKEQPEYVFNAAAKVGGILSNSVYRAQYIYENLMIQNNIIHSCYLNNVKKMLFLGSSCIYPKSSPQPIKEEYLMTGKLEPTNSSYAVAKIAGVEMCWAYNKQFGTKFIPVMPTNLYGPNDNFDLESSHVLPALLRKFHLAKMSLDRNLDGIQNDEKLNGRIPDDILESLGIKRFSQSLRFISTPPEFPAVILWGTGKPRREFLYVDDLADACIYLMKINDKQLFVDDCPLFNIGTGLDLTTSQLAELIKSITSFTGNIVYDLEKPDGTPQKLLDVSRLKDLGWQSRTSLEDGLRKIYSWYTR
jgi:GDP-L-fucose synthase